MKKNYILSFIASAILFSGSVVAQPTLTSANMTPNPGVAYQNYPINAPGIDQGPAGANQTWDFSQLTLGTSYTITNFLTAGSAFANSFPGATHYSTHSLNNSKSFSIFNSSEWSLRGVTVDGGPTFDYTNPQKMLSFPLTFNNSFTDSYSANYTSGVPMVRTGTLAATADGYGTVIMPGGQVLTNVLRVKMTDNITDSFNGAPIMTSVGEGYYWFKPGHQATLFSIYKLTANGQTTTSVSAYPLLSVGTEDETVNGTFARLYPNPAKGFVTVHTGSGQTVSATLVNGLGQEIRKQMLAPNEDKFSLDGISSGVYFLQLNADKQTITKKLIVE